MLRRALVKTNNKGIAQGKGGRHCLFRNIHIPRGSVAVVVQEERPSSDCIMTFAP